MSDDVTDRVRRPLGAWQLYAFAFGATVGGSWIVLVGAWLQLAGPAGATIAFIIGGLEALVVGFCYAELGSLFPMAGGELVFAKRIFGVVAAHVVGWILLLLYLALVAFEAVSVSWIVAEMFPSILGPTLYSVGGADIHLGGASLGIAASLVIALTNYRGAKSAGQLQDWLTIGKLVIAAVFIGFGLYAADADNFQPLFGAKQGMPALTDFFVLLSSTPLFFAGFSMITQAMGEAKPQECRRLGKILIAVIVTSMVFYLLIIAVVAGLVPAAKLAGYELPAVQAFDAAFGARAVTQVVLSVALLGLLTVWNATFFAAVRVFEGLAAEGLIGGAWLIRRDVRHSPRIPVMLVLIISLTGILIGRTLLLPIMSVAGLAVTLLFLFVCCANLARRQRSNAVAPYCAPGGVATVWTGVVLSLLLVATSLFALFAGRAGGFPAEVMVMLGWGILGYGAWLVNRKARG